MLEGVVGRGWLWVGAKVGIRSLLLVSIKEGILNLAGLTSY